MSFISKRKSNLLTKEFLTDLKDELLKLNPKFINHPESHFAVFNLNIREGSFDKALFKVCVKYNLVKAIYNYSNSLYLPESDFFKEDIIGKMVNENIINNEKDEELLAIPYDIKAKIIKKHKGYNVIRYEHWFKDDKEWVENHYKDCEIEWEE